MLPILAEHLDQIEVLCRKYRVMCLEAFGSVARGDFDPATSDVDFLVLFDKRDSSGLVDQYFGLLQELERVVGRPVDLVDIQAARNPYFIADALRHRIRLYAEHQSSLAAQMQNPV
jgi:predicted nucleotidyltransferase